MPRARCVMRKKKRKADSEVPPSDPGGSQQSSRSSPRKPSPRKPSPSAANTSTNSTRKKLSWRLLLFGDEVVSHPLSLEKDDESDDDGGHTAADLPTDASRSLRDVQLGASLDNHVEDIVSVNDVFVSDVQRSLDAVQTEVVQEVELGSIPTAALPGPLRSLVSGLHMPPPPPPEDHAAPAGLASADADLTKEACIIEGSTQYGHE